jgi:ribosome-binding ATPase YchF (GTP1/OBG family)
MQIAIIGPQYSGKTTVFRALTGQAVPSEGVELHIATVSVEDERLDFLKDTFKPKKLTHAMLDFIDTPRGKDPLSIGRDADAFLGVIPLFGEFSDPIAAFEELKQEMFLRDLEICDSRIEKIMKAKSPEDERELTLLQNCKEALDKEMPIRKLEFAELDEKIIRGFQFLTLKPIVIVINISEKKRDDPKISFFKEHIKDELVLTIMGKLESELWELPEADISDYMKELQISERAYTRVTKAIYKAADLITFFTVRGDETRAWQINRGTNAVHAAGKVHTDMEKGFIKAEVIGFDDFKTIGSLAEAKRVGKFRLEGKDYVVNDGDIIEFKFAR